MSSASSSEGEIMAEKRKMTSTQAMKEFFSDSARPLSLQEMKALSPAERTELGKLAAIACGAEWTETAPVMK
jgi:hypothetical protein